MEIQTTRFGATKFDDSAVLTFTQPIIGFREFRRFVVLPGPPDSAVVWLQSTESPELAFILMDPRDVAPSYTVKLSEHELAELAVSTVDELDIYTIVVVPQDRSKVRTNLKAPILINKERQLAKQTILDKTDYPVQFFLEQAQQGTEEPKEVSNARSDA
jgi:flagellar assembly factor FliW